MVAGRKLNPDACGAYLEDATHLLVFRPPTVRARGCQPQTTDYLDRLLYLITVGVVALIESSQKLTAVPLAQKTAAGFEVGAPTFPICHQLRYHLRGVAVIGTKPDFGGAGRSLVLRWGRLELESAARDQTVNCPDGARLPCYGHSVLDRCDGSEM